MPCPKCADPLAVYYSTNSLGMNLERHSVLYRCPFCGTLFEVFPEERVLPREITNHQARERFPGVDLSASS